MSSGRDVKPRLARMPGQGRAPRASLVAAAAAEQPEGPAPAAPSRQPADASSAMDVDAPTAPTPAPISSADILTQMAPSTSAGPSSIGASRSNSGNSERSASAAAPPAAAPAPSAGPGANKMKFKPKMPIRRAPQPAEAEVKPEPSFSASRGRPAVRARGRGGAARGGGAPRQSFGQTVAAGPFGGTRASNSGSRRVVAPPPPPRNYMADPSSIEVYSDNEDGTRTGVIDIEAVSALSESAPTSIFRDRDLDGGKAKAKEAEKAKIKDLKRRKRAERVARAAALVAAGNAAQFDSGAVGVKAEPVSPAFVSAPLPDGDAPLTREGDSMIPGDEQEDRDAEGRRVRALTTGTTGTSGDVTPESEEVNAAHAVDLSESESEEEEEDMEGDFVFVDGMDNPEDKLFTFQLPAAMPKFVSRAPVDVTGDDAVAAGAPGAAAAAPEETKPTAAALRGRRKSAAAPPPEGRIGTLCVMKSGKVKLVMGEGDEGIVMNVTPGVPTTFLQQLVHLDAKHKSTTVLGEVHRGYVVTPDVDRLLEQLFINGGETPGDREKEQAKIDRRIKMERGLVKMEPSSP